MAEMWVIVQHMAWEGPGLIAEAMQTRGIPYHIVHSARGEPLPAASECDGLVVMGGTMGVYEARLHPHLRGEQDLLAACVTGGKPVLGICLGSQLLAAALGATVGLGAVLEKGAGEVTLTAEGHLDAVFGANAAKTLPVVHWHHDTYTLPEGAVRLASTSSYPQQAFRYGECVYGMQFHPEVDAALAAEWAGQGLSLSPAEVESVAGAGKLLLARYFARVS